MRVVHLVSSGQLGGTEACLVEITASLKQAYPDWSLGVVAPQEGPLAARLRAMDVPVDVIPFPPAVQRLGEAGRTQTARGRARVVVDVLRAGPAVAGYRRRIRARLTNGDRRRVDVVHAHGFKMQVVSALARPRHVRLIWHMHDYISSRFVSARLLRHLVSRCSTVVANSRSVASDVRAVCPSANVVTVYNAVDVARFSPDGHALDLDALGGVAPPAAGVVRIGLVGTFGRWKGHLTLLRALARLDPATGIRVYIVGGPQYQSAESQHTEAALRDAAREIGVSDRVVFTGAVGDVPAALRSLDIVVHASTEPEPFGMVIAEAMACGRAVVFARAGGAAELVDEGVDAIGHCPGDDEDLARALGRLATHAELRSGLGAAARRSAVVRFDRARLGRELGPLYTA